MALQHEPPAWRICRLFLPVAQCNATVL